MLRRCETNRLALWLAVSRPTRIKLTLKCETGFQVTLTLQPGQTGCTLLTAGKHLHYLLLDVALESPLPTDHWIDYAVWLQATDCDDAQWTNVAEMIPHLRYPGQQQTGWVLPARVGSLLHGSCRKPHHRGSGDGLLRADGLIAQLLQHGHPRSERQDSEVTPSDDTSALPAWPSLLMMTGDQVYADDVAGPMLHAIHQVISLLGLPDEPIAGAEDLAIDSARALYGHPASFYHRERLLPSRKHHYALIEVLFGGVEKPVFTTDKAHNHLITLGEVLAMYLLVWSPALWPLVNLNPPQGLNEDSQRRYHEERKAIEAFVAGLPAVQRLFAHIPTAMIFDDHDITDDWNLSREWEEVAYGHPFSRRVIGNAMIGYLLHQGWGNKPDAFGPDLMDGVKRSLQVPGGPEHEQLIEQLIRFDQWHYTWPTHPPLVVIDTRTHRWRSESAARQPSGLLDWEALTDLQQTIKGHPSVLLVSPAPIFGVKLIEAIQRVFTWFGKPLMVDAENWMAHPGAAHAILNIFRHPKTPRHFVVLSGDVHYSFVYDVELRGRIRGPDIWQICSSGLRNEFPERLLDWLDRANRWLYSPRSPLNWLTRRRHMRVIPRKPEGASHGRRLLNGSGIGLVEIDETGVPWRIRQLLCDGRVVGFGRQEDESSWH